MLYLLQLKGNKDNYTFKKYVRTLFIKEASVINHFNTLPYGVAGGNIYVNVFWVHYDIWNELFLAYIGTLF